MNIFQKLLLKFFNILLVLMTFLSATAMAANGKQVFIPIDVGGITTFIPVLSTPSNVSVSINSATVGGDVYDLTWNTVSNAAYYQVVVEDENGTKRIVETTDLSYNLAGLPLGSSTVSLLACNSEDYCGAATVIGTYNTTERVRYAHADILGSPILETDQAGNVISELHYKPFGETEEEKREDIGYTGHLEDSDLQLTYMQARYYDPVVGRFYANDPVGFTGDPYSFNRYAYGNNNPYKYTDPDGESPILIAAGIGATINTIAYVATTDFSNMSKFQVASGVVRSAFIGAAVGAATSVGAGAAVAAKFGAVRTAANVVGAGFAAGGAGEIANQSLAAGKLTVSDPGAVLASAAGNTVGAIAGATAAKPIAGAISKFLSDAGSDGTGATIRSLSGKPFKPMGYRAPNIVSAPKGAVAFGTEAVGGGAGAGTTNEINTACNAGTGSSGSC